MPAERSLLASAGFVAILGLTGCNAALGPTNVDANWHTFDSAHFTLFTRPGSFAEANQQRLGEVLDDQYQWTLQVLGLPYRGRISAFLYVDAADAGLMSNYSGVAYPGTETMRATCAGPLDGSLFALLQHEANHVIQQTSLGRPGTSFVNEGLPSAVASTRYHEYGPEFLFQWTAAHLSVIPPIAQLADDEKWNGSEVAYKSSASFLAYLLERGGAASMRSLYQVTSKDFGRRISEIYGESLDALDADWRAFCTARASMKAGAGGR
jgi:hypothetical protein